jgi:pimeloyl-ACP methyl ester carboxylesterase
MNQLHYQYLNIEKPVLLLIHGFLGSMQQWDYLEKDLVQQYSLLKIELPGHGFSPEFSKDYTLVDLVQEIDRILEAECIDTVHIMGHSMGGYLGSAFAKARSQKVKSLILLNSIASEDSEERKAMRDRSLLFIDKHGQAYVKMAVTNLFNAKEQEQFKNRILLMKQQAQHISIKSVAQALKCMRFRESSLQDLFKLKVFVSYIYGSQDQIITPSQILEEVAFLNAKHLQLDSGHMSLLTDTDAILDQMKLLQL